MKKRFQTVIQSEIDTETGKSRILKQFTFPIGEPRKPKKQTKRLTSSMDNEEYM